MASPEQEIPYDQNFVFPLQDLANERVRLTPFVPAKHAAAFFDATIDHPDMYAHNASGPYTSISQLVHDVFGDPSVPGLRTTVLFAAFAKNSSSTTDPSDTEKMVGILSYFDASPANLSVEIGIMTVPAFQRTHVTSNAVGLLMQYAFGPLALRRVEWQCSTANTASMNAAKRLGFQLEGIKRWDRVYPKGKVGNGLSVGAGRGEGVGRDTAVLSVCWDDWESGVKEKLQAVMDRTK